MTHRGFWCANLVCSRAFSVLGSSGVVSALSLIGSVWWSVGFWSRGLEPGSIFFLEGGLAVDMNLYFGAQLVSGAWARG